MMRHLTNSSRIILLLALAYCVVTLVLLAMWGASSYISIRETRIENAGRVATLLEERFRRTIVATDSILQQAEAAARSTLAAGRSLDSLSVEQLRGFASSLPDEGSLWIVDANGDLATGSAGVPAQSTNYADREFFPVHRNGLPFFISGGAKGRLTGKYHWRISRRIDGPDGRFAGAVLAQLQAESLEQLYHAVEVGPDSVMTLYRQDGALMMRYPMADRFLSGTLKGDPWFESIWTTQEPSGTFQKPSVVDRVERIFVWRKIDGRPLALFVGVSQKSLTDAWLRQSWRYAGVLLIALVPLAFLMVLGTRTARDEQRQRERLEEAVQERTAELSRALEAAERAADGKSRFLAAASHDLRQPMQSLFLFASALHRYVQDEKGRGVLEHLERGLDTLKSLLDTLLDISRLDAGAVTPAIEVFPIAALLDHIAAGYAPVAQGKGLAWRVTTGPHYVRSDRVLLGRLVRNLIENAVRYTREGSVAIECKAIGGRLRIAVSDTGIGIPPEQQSRIFEEFHQIDNLERDRSQGLGLGLAIVQRISQLLDLSVTLRSEPGQGSVFSVEVPLGERPADDHPARAEPATAAEAGGEERTSLERLALVIDDDAMVLLSLQTLLKEWGYDVLIAGSGEQAVEKLQARNRRPDVVVADYRLRKGEVGTTAILAVRAWCGADIPGIIMTGETGSECQQDAATHGFGLMHKPVTPRQLSGALDRLLVDRWANPAVGSAI